MYARGRVDVCACECAQAFFFVSYVLINSIMLLNVVVAVVSRPCLVLPRVLSSFVCVRVCVLVCVC